MRKILVRKPEGSQSEYLRLGWRIIIKLDVKNTLGGGICVRIGPKSDGFSEQLSCYYVLKLRN